MTAKVIPMKPTKPASPKVTPPEGWKDSEGIGYLGTKSEAGETVPLVFVHDVAAWLLKSMPLKQVTETVCNAILRHGLDGVYRVSADDFAERYDAPSEWDQFFGGDKATQLTDGLRAVWLMKQWELERLVNNPEYPPVFDAEKSTAFEFSRRPHDPHASIAVTHELAHSLWGWGSVSEVVPLRSVTTANADPKTWSDLVSYRKEHIGANWPPAHKKILASEFDRRSAIPGVKGVAKAMAAELPGKDDKPLSVKRFNELKATKSEPGKRQASASKAA